MQRRSERDAAMHVPQHDGSANVCRREAASVGTERQASGADVIVELSDQAVSVHVPQDRAAGTSGREDAPIGTERDAIDRSGACR